MFVPEGELELELENWRIGELENWRIGEMECLSVGVLEGAIRLMRVAAFEIVRRRMHIDFRQANCLVILA